MSLPWQRFCQRLLYQNFQLFERNGIFLAKIVFISDFLVQIRNQRPKIDPCAKFQPDWTKGKGSRISTSNDSENCLMTSHTHLIVMMSSRFLMILRDFVPKYPEKYGGMS